TKCAVLIPMILINSFLGVLVIENQEANKYIDNYPEVLTSVAQIIGMSIRIHRKLEWGLIK
ncbi:MAG TPA: hypothetical protein PL110_17705, partial [Candidatus Eremiobacteraeota bacterium]|nr:hypothetical protein [Candidatus Eremiobacteraeota bacterium]